MSPLDIVEDAVLPPDDLGFATVYSVALSSR